MRVSVQRLKNEEGKFFLIQRRSLTKLPVRLEFNSCDDGGPKNIDLGLNDQNKEIFSDPVWIKLDDWAALCNSEL